MKEARQWEGTGIPAGIGQQLASLIKEWSKSSDTRASIPLATILSPRTHRLPHHTSPWKSKGQVIYNTSEQDLQANIETWDDGQKQGLGGHSDDALSGLNTSTDIDENDLDA